MTKNWGALAREGKQMVIDQSNIGSRTYLKTESQRNRSSRAQCREPRMGRKRSSNTGARGIGEDRDVLMKEEMIVQLDKKMGRWKCD